MNLTENWKQYLEELADPEKLDVSSFEIQDSLQSDVWESEEKLNKEIILCQENLKNYGFSFLLH